MIRVMIAAEHAEVRESLRTALELAEDIEIAAVVHGTCDGLSAAAERGTHDGLSAVPGCGRLDAALVDLDAPGGEGLETVQQMHALCPGLPVIALTAHDYPAARETVIRAGACVVMVKGLPIPEMHAVIRGVVEKT